MRSVITVGLLCAASACGATVTSARFVEIDNGQIDDGLLNLAGTRTFDLILDFDDTLEASSIAFQLDQGEFVYHPGGTRQPSPGGLLDLAPALAFDTQLLRGSVNADESQPMFIFGGAVDLNQLFDRLDAIAPTFEPQYVSATWDVNIGLTVPPQDDFLAARITVTEETVGRLTVLLVTGGSPSSASPVQERQRFDFEISPIPEPTCVVLALLAAGAVGSPQRGS